MRKSWAPFWRRNCRRFRRDDGSALVEAIVALALSGFAFVQLIGHVRIIDIIPAITAVRAEQIASFAAGAQRYVTTYRDAIDAAIVAAGGAPQVVTPAMLQAANSLPAGYADGGLAPALVVRRDPALAQLDPLVVVTGRQFDDVELAAIAKELRRRNVDGGGIMTTDPNQIVTSSWRKPAANFAGGGLSLPVGTAAATLKLQDGSASNWLSRTRVDSQPDLNRMETALDMGNHDVTGARAVSASAGITAGGNIVTSGYLRSTRIVTAGDSCSATNDIGGLVRDSSGKPLYCDATSGTFAEMAGGRPTVSFAVQSYMQGIWTGQAPLCPPDSFESTPSYISYALHDPSTGWMIQYTRWCWRYIN